MGRIVLAVWPLLLVGSGITFAAPASAGCESQFGATYCDGPIRADGTWDRCFQTSGEPFFGGQGQIAGFVPSTGRCYPYDPNNPPGLPLGQPADHVYP